MGGAKDQASENRGVSKNVHRLGWKKKKGC
jgi:hypothetical protein